MNKIDFIRGKPLEYEWGKDEKSLTVKPLTNGELIDLVDEFQDEWDAALNTELEDEKFLDIVREKPVYFINKVVKEEFTQDDFLSGYPNDLYNIFRAFKEVNFTFLSRLQGSQIVQMLRPTQTKQQSK